MAKKRERGHDYTLAPWAVLVMDDGGITRYGGVTYTVRGDKLMVLQKRLKDDEDINKAYGVFLEEVATKMIAWGDELELEKKEERQDD